MATQATNGTPGADLLIRNADRVVAFDAASGGHVYLTGADVAVQDGRVCFVGRGFAGRATREVDGRGLMVMPGLVDLHSHPWSESMNRGFGEDLTNPATGTSMYEHKPGWGDDVEGWLATSSVAYAELLRSGTTTLVDLITPFEGWIENLAASGLRGFVAPMMRSALWSLPPDGGAVIWNWFEDGGAESFARGLEAVDAAIAHPSGRLSAMVMPAQVDTCTERFLQDALAAARARGIGFQTHAAQVEPEVAEMERRHGMTPIAWMEAIGVLGPDVTLSHAPFLDHHPALGRSGPFRDLEILGRAGANVAHCPTLLTRNAMMLHDFRRYREAGITMTLGTDTSPQNMWEEMRNAAVMARAASYDVTACSATDVFNAATLGGARALGRDDLGRISVGACADLVLVDLAHRSLAPGNDPIRTMVFNAAERPVRDVYVGGEQVGAGGVVLAMDEDAKARAMTAAHARAIKAYPTFDRDGRAPEVVAPPAFPMA